MAVELYVVLDTVTSPFTGSSRVTQSTTEMNDQSKSIKKQQPTNIYYTLKYSIKAQTYLKIRPQVQQLCYSSNAPTHSLASIEANMYTQKVSITSTHWFIARPETTFQTYSHIISCQSISSIAGVSGS